MIAAPEKIEFRLPFFKSDRSDTGSNSKQELDHFKGVFFHGFPPGFLSGQRPEPVVQRQRVASGAGGAGCGAAGPGGPGGGLAAAATHGTRAVGGGWTKWEGPGTNLSSNFSVCISFVALTIWLERK